MTAIKTKTRKKRQMKTRNPVAKVLRKFNKAVIMKDKTKYDRKKIKREGC